MANASTAPRQSALLLSEFESDAENVLTSMSVNTEGKVVAALYMRAITMWSDSLVDYCESPIEQLFLAVALNVFPVSRARSLGKTGRKLLPDYWDGSGLVGHVEHGLLLQQFEVRIPGHAYHVDFALVGRRFKIAIELDGHDFHERTKEQARRDKSRDRALQAIGWHVLRFTGSEVYRNATACVYEVENLARKLNQTKRTGSKP
jgi:very-short-patch-repair endonuclease